MRTLALLCLFEVTVQESMDTYRKICNVQTCSKCDKYVARFAFKKDNPDRAFQFCSSILQMSVGNRDCCDRGNHIMQFGFVLTSPCLCQEDEKVVQVGNKFVCANVGSLKKFEISPEDFEELKLDLFNAVTAIESNQLEECQGTSSVRSELNVCEKVLNEMDAQSDGMGKTYSCGENTAAVNQLLVYALGGCVTIIAMMALGWAYMAQRTQMLRKLKGGYENPSESEENLTATSPTPNRLD